MYHITPKSGNAKTGPIPVTTTTAKTCPTACPFNHNNAGGCYADYGPLALHWRKVTAGERGMDWPAFVARIAALPDGILWRYGQAGDLPGAGDKIDRPKLRELTAANSGKKNIAYSHKPITGPHGANNAAAILAANADGFVINLSGNNPAHADMLADSGIAPVVTVLPSNAPDISTTPGGRRIVKCPAESRPGVTCESCGLCAVPMAKRRGVIVGFPAHGTGKKRASAVASENILPDSVQGA